MKKWKNKISFSELLFSSDSVTLMRNPKWNIIKTIVYTVLKILEHTGALWRCYNRNLVRIVTTYELASSAGLIVLVRNVNVWKLLHIYYLLHIISQVFHFCYKKKSKKKTQTHGVAIK